ncbi:MAG: sulfatase-like hydrolase/transferase, partial [Armatimonadota bacterium]
DQGYYVWWGGKNDMINMGVIDDACHERVQGAGDKETFTERPWEAGDRLYHTFLFGEVPENWGTSVADDNVAEKAAEFIREPKDEPFFMLVNQTWPHPPYAVFEPYYSMYDRSEVPFPIRPPENWEGKPEILQRVHERTNMDEVTDDELREMVAVYYGMITKTDRNLGWLMEALKDSGQWDDTIVIATSDHGDFCGDYQMTEKMQNTFEDCLTNVPFAVRVPGCDPFDATSEELCEWVDILPTLAEACDIELGHTVFGKSLMPLLRGETDKHKPYAYSEGGALMEEIHTHETSRPFENIYWSRPALQFEEPRVHGKAVMIRSHDFKYVRRMYDTDELYDLRKDPDEVHNLIDDATMQDVVDEMSQAMLDWFLHTGDQVPIRWDLRSPGREHPEWSAKQTKHGFVRDVDEG